MAVFDLMECNDPSDVLEYSFPPLPYRLSSPFFRSGPQSPIVGIWDGAVFIASETGFYDAQKLLRNEGLLK